MKSQRFYRAIPAQAEKYHQRIGKKNPAGYNAGLAVSYYNYGLIKNDDDYFYLWV